MKLCPVHNRRLGLWNLCHDQWCQRGETSIVATITTTGDAEADEKMAQLICERFNAAATFQKIVNEITYTDEKGRYIGYREDVNVYEELSPEEVALLKQPDYS